MLSILFMTMTVSALSLECYERKVTPVVRICGNRARGVSVDKRTDNIYAVSEYNNRVEVFYRDGNFMF